MSILFEEESSHQGGLNSDLVQEELDMIISNLDAAETSSSSQTSPSLTHPTSPAELSSQCSSASHNSFRKIPELYEIFERRPWKDKRATGICRHCKRELNSNRLRSLLRHVVEDCKATPAQTKARFSAIRDSHFKSTRPDDYDKFLKVLIMENWPFRIVESSRFKSWLDDVNPSYKIPSRADISEVYIPRLSESYNQDFLRQLKRQRDFSMSVEFDHWQDASGLCILGVLATKQDGSRHLIELRDVTLETKTAIDIEACLKEILSQIPHVKINSVISDSASNCMLARQCLVQARPYSHILSHRCIAHFLNRVGEQVCSDESLEMMMSISNRLVSHIGKSPKLTALLREFCNRKLVSSCETRWYSKVDMLEVLLQMKEGLKKYLEDQEFSQIVKDEIFWNDMQSALQVLRPLANCIACAERSSGSLGESFKVILEFGRYIFNSDLEREMNLAAARTFLKYFNDKKLKHGELDLLVSAYAMDRRFKLDYLTDAAIEVVLKTLINLVEVTGYSMKDVGGSLVKEFSAYCNQEYPFGTIPSQDETASEWWSKISQSIILKPIAERLANLKSSSANIERTFSACRLTQGALRTRLSLENLQHLVRSKISIQNEEFELKSAKFEASVLDSEPSEVNIDWISDYFRPRENSERDLPDHFERFFHLFDFGRVNCMLDKTKDAEMVDNDENGPDKWIRLFRDSKT